MTPPPLPPINPPALAPGERLLPTLAAVGGAVILGDFLFWNYEVGLSLGLYAVLMAVLLLARHRTVALESRVLIPFGLLLISAVQSAIEISFTNLAVLTVLFAVLLGETAFPALPRGWARWSESFIAWILALGRWPWLASAVNQQSLHSRLGARQVGSRMARAFRIVLPALSLLIVFGIIFAIGNGVFRNYLAHWGEGFSKWVTSLDFSVGRIFFLLFLATGALALFRPRDGAKTSRAWARPFGEWRRVEDGLPFWQSALTLVALNALFCAINTLDVVYLWLRTEVPEGVSGRDYLYEGVYSLIAATVLAGIVICVLFQQSPSVTNSRPIKGLAYLWIAQNLLLISGVFLRLKLFLDGADFTPKRVYVACFLLLVLVGFLLLCRQVALGRRSSQLIWQNALATFVLFFVLQFLNVAGWVGQQNLGRWVKVPGTGVNIGYNLTLGPGVWPVLMEMTQSPLPGTGRAELIHGLQELAKDNAISLPKVNWRERQWRRDRNAALLKMWAAQNRGDS